MKLPPWDEIADDFRTEFSEFDQKDDTMYSNELIVKALKRTKYFIGPRWGQYKEGSNMQLGWFFLAAHAIFMTQQQIAAAETGIEPGSVRGVDSTTINDESVSFGSQIMLKLKPWNDELASSLYGVEFMRRRDAVSKIGVVV